ncbi:ParB/RepB/Spo0J family partition protein [Novosphingobium piscinae]|uniref:ParB/RepB/Spo0J family partition protein n=1 Tax=Novosphingobium piscinae TaxID=1507448 RepID=A0A7X1KRK7_9SPHN|nr:ParB/RepB/Spo0J family partition protein [Novosphingobium piscinae]MBC2670725.1 ParB/RepB/Spo0J family partition protein [Novosphingobium piscinae]
MERKNRGFASSLTSALTGAKPDDPPRPSAQPTRDLLATRSNRLAELATGASVAKTQYQVDPAKCRMWAHHNRDYAALDFERCKDLIESIKAQGKQEVPAIVRRVAGDPAVEFEVICGARRHWSVSWLREHNYPNIRFLVEVRDLTDEEAFRVADLENRAREDLTDYERARDYLRALGTYYGGVQKDMAERLNVTPSWLSRYLDLARLPGEIVAAFASPHELRIKHVTQLKPLLKPPAKYALVEQRAQALAAARIGAAADGGGGGKPLAAADVIRQLAAAYKGPQKVRIADAAAGSHETIMDSRGKPIMTVHKPRRGEGVSLTLIPDGKGNRAEVVAAFERLLARYWPE